MLAVIFDLDGVLIDSEPLWHEAEIEVFGRLGVPIDRDRCRETTGLRTEEVVAHWYRRFPWSEPAPAAVADELLQRVGELVATRGKPMPGAKKAVELVRARGLLVALASSSPRPLIDAALARLGLAHFFDVIHSAADETWGKPHPGVYLTAAAQLGVAPAACLAVEDSVNGVLAAKAARMACVALPAAEERDDPRFSLADEVIGSAKDIDSGFLDRWERDRPAAAATGPAAPRRKWFRRRPAPVDAPGPAAAVPPTPAAPPPPVATRPDEAPCCSASVAELSEGLARWQLLAGSLRHTRDGVLAQRDALRRGLEEVVAAAEAGEPERARQLADSLWAEQAEIARRPR